MLTSNLCHVPYNPLTRNTAPSKSETRRLLGELRDGKAAFLPYDALDLAILAERQQSESDIQSQAREMVFHIAAQPQYEQGALSFIREHADDKWPDSYPGWLLLEELFDDIAALPGAGLGFRSLLRDTELFRQANQVPLFPMASCDIIREKLEAMIARISAAAQAELEEYEAGKNERGSRPADIYRRYGVALRYAVEELGSFRAKEALNALTLATTVPVTEMESPAWVDPYTGDGELDYELVYIRDTTAELSSDGNLPASVADMLESLSDDGRNTFHRDLEALGMTVGDYWRQFIEAQRSGFCPLPEHEDEREEVEFDAIEKDFSFKADLTVSADVLNEIRQKHKMDKHEERMQALMQATAKETARAYGELARLYQAVSAFRRGELSREDAGRLVAEQIHALTWDIKEALDLAKKLGAGPDDVPNLKQIQKGTAWKTLRASTEEERAWEEEAPQVLVFTNPPKVQLFLEQSIDWVVEKRKLLAALVSDLGRYRFFNDRLVRDLIGTFSRWACSGKYEPKDLLAFLLPYQNAYGFRDELTESGHTRSDLALIRVPQAWGSTLSGFYEVHGDEFLEQYLTKVDSGIRPSYDPTPRELEIWTEDVVGHRQRMYLSKTGARLYRMVYRDHKGTTAEKKAAAQQWFDWIYAQERAEELAKIKRIGLKPNQRLNREFVEAEVAASLLGDGGQDGPQQAGWDAWRGNIDEDANQAFKVALAKIRQQQKTEAEAEADPFAQAMAVFWERVRTNNRRKANTFKTVLKGGRGVVLENGREIDWGIFKRKIEAGELTLSQEQAERLLAYLVNNKYAPWFQAFLRGKVLAAPKQAA